MKIYLPFFVALLFPFLMQSQKVGVGTTVPAAALDIRGIINNPTIPGLNSTGILRIGVSSFEGIDIGKLGTSPYSAWMQSGFNATEADPLSLQPMGGAVGIGTVTPEVSAVLDVQSNTQGFMPPRMSMENRNGIVNPKAGLMIWCNNCGVYGQAQVFNGHIWTGTAGNAGMDMPVIGDADGGGIVAYIFQPGDPGYVAGEVHGLIAKSSDEAPAPWGCQGTVLPGADGIVIGTGNQNTIDIVNG
jgi:hypothetical protein